MTTVNFTELQFFFRGHFARVVLKHDRNAILHRVAEAAGLAQQFARGLAIKQRPLADGADKYVEQLFIHGGGPLRAGR